MKNFLYILSIIIFILCACIFSDAIISGCKAGITLWYSSVLPVTLPFMLITGLVTELIDRLDISGSFAYAVILSVGLLCGFPTGTMIITAFYDRGIISEKNAQLLLPLCNNVSSMFLCGYIYKGFMSGLLSFVGTIFLLYVPQLIYTAGALLFSHMMHRRADCHVSDCTAASLHTDTDILYGSIRSIAVIGLYMSVFSIIMNLMMLLLPPDRVRLSAAFMEVSQGITLISRSDISAKQKTALILSLTSFGGLSAIFQSHALIRDSGLSFVKYISGKCICGILCYIFSLCCLGSL